MMKKTFYTLFMMLLVAGVIDIALAGPVDPVKKCNTCGMPLSLCPGHDTAKPKKERNEKPKKQTEPKKESKPNKKQVAPAGYDVTITSNAGRDATLYIDGTNYGKSSGSHYLKVGSHSVILTADGYDDFYRTINVDKNNTWFSFTMIEKSTEALCQLGENYFKGTSGYPKDFNKAVHWFRKAADQGNAEAQYNLGYCYAHGIGVDQDDSEAVKYYRKAADQGNVSAQYNLGYCYKYGQGVDRNYSEAAKWFRKAAEQGNAWAQYDLGYCYEHGEGVIRDRSEAIQWYRKAADQGNDDAKLALKRLESPDNPPKSSSSSSQSTYRTLTSDHSIDWGDGIVGGWYTYSKYFPIGFGTVIGGSHFSLGLDFGVNIDKKKIYPSDNEIVDPKFYANISPGFFYKFFSINCGIGAMTYDYEKTTISTNTNENSSGYNGGHSSSSTSVSVSETKQEFNQMSFLLKPSIEGRIPICGGKRFITVNVGYLFMPKFKDLNGFTFGIGFQWKTD